MEKLGANVLRERFLAFFESKDHLRHASFPLVPQGDNSLLLINSGMAPLKPFFSGEAAPPSLRMTTCQKCIRTPDIERVGKTSRHGTFFEMLGNFSFGDYFKKEACAWAWEFITECLEIPKDKLYVTVYLDDDEAALIWENDVGVDPSHISRLGKADNFWEIGSGPCGPCSEIYFDRGEKYGCGSPDCKVGCDCDRYVEFWNLVFTQFNNDGQGNYTELANKNIDTGMGLERLACIMQQVGSLFDVDTVMNITNHVSKITGVVYGESAEADISLRVITDHIRSTTMMVCDGVLPSNEGRGYVLRRLLRRASRHGKLLGVREPFLHELCRTVISESMAAYPELYEKREYIIKVIKNEEDNFAKTLDAGMAILDGIIERLENAGQKAMSGEDSFKLYDTYGFPIDLTLEILDERGFSIDMKVFESLMDEQRRRAREAAATLGDFGWAGLDLGLSNAQDTVFTGYSDFSGMASVLAVAADNKPCQCINLGQNAAVVLDKTPFYAESGGQVSDTGFLTSPEVSFRVNEVRKTRDNKFLHIGVVEKGSLTRGISVQAEIDVQRRHATMRAHSATHLLHKALRSILGNHVEQAGSLVSPDAIRFDFTHFSPVSAGELEKVENLVNDAIFDSLVVSVLETSQDEAKEMGAMALFGEKYGTIVRVVKMGDYSIELCAGTHLDNTSKIGCFRIMSEYSVASGVRRIEARVGKGLLEFFRDRGSIIDKISVCLKSPPAELVSRVESFMAELRENRKQVENLKTQGLYLHAQRLLDGAVDIGGLTLINERLGEFTADELRRIGDYLRDKSDDVVAVLSTVSGGKITFHAICGKLAVKRGIKAGGLIKDISAAAGGSGGGKPESAMGGGQNPQALEKAHSLVQSYISENMKE